MVSATHVVNVPAGPGYKAQNNTQTIFTDPDAVARFQAELIAEHHIAQSQQAAASPAAGKRQRHLGEAPVQPAAGAGGQH